MDGSQLSAEDLLGPRPGGDAQAAPEGSAEALLGPRPMAPARPALPSTLFSSTPIVGPLMDAYFNNVQNPNGAAARILHAFRVGGQNSWGADTFALPQETQDLIKQMGMEKQQKDDHASWWKSMSEAYMRAQAANAATGLAMETGGMQSIARLPATIGAIGAGLGEAAVQAGRETGTETGQQIGQTIAGGIEYGMSRGDILNPALRSPLTMAREVANEPFTPPRERVEPIPPEITEGNHLGTIGTTDAQWLGLEEAPPPSDEALAEAAKRRDEESKEPATVPGEAPPAPEQEGIRAIPEENAGANLDLEAARRQINPQAFQQYDALQLQLQTQRRWLQELAETRDRAITDPIDQQIADQQAKLDAGATGKRAATYRNRIAELQEQRAKALEEGNVDTKDMRLVRDDMTKARNRLYDLAPDITAATQEAADRLGVQSPAERLGAPAPVAPPEAAPEPAIPEQPSAAPEQAAEAQPAAPPPTPIEEGLATQRAAAEHPQLKNATYLGKNAEGNPVYERSDGLRRVLRPNGMVAMEAPGARGSVAGLAGTERAYERGEEFEVAEPKGAPPRLGGEQGELLPPATPAKAPANFSVAEDVSKKLVAAGRPQAEADAAAAVVEAMYEARAARWQGAKGSAADLYQQDRPEIRTGEAKKGRRFARGKHDLTADGRRIITLSKSRANASTFMHELGHDFVSQLLFDADQEGAPADIKADAQTLRDYAFADESGGIDEKGEEQLARGFERYLMEGTAPTPRLAAIFQQFQQWLQAIYEKVSKLKQPPKITDELRGVFARAMTPPGERVVIHPDREPLRGLGDLHESEAEATPPEHAAEAASQIRADRDAAAAAHVPEEEHARLAGAREPVARGAEGDREPNGPNAGPVPSPGEARVPEGVGAVGAGGGAIAAEGPRARAEVLEAAEKLGPTGRLYEPVPREPKRLLDWIKQQGGIKADEGGEITKIARDTAGANWEKDKRFKGLINPKTGASLDDLALAAWEDGYLPELNDRPDINTLINAIEDDVRGDNPRYSERDADIVNRIEQAKAKNAEIDEIATKYGIDAANMSKKEFLAAYAEKLSEEEAAKQFKSFDDAQQADFEEAQKRLESFIKSRGEAWEPEDYIGRTRSLEDLEHEFQQEQNASAAGAGASGVRQPENPPGHQEPLQSERGQSGGGIRVVGGAGGEEEPTLASDRFPERDERLVDKAANIRLENITNEEDARESFRQLAKANNNFQAERRGVVPEAHRQALAYAIAMDPASLAMNTDRLAALSYENDVPLGAMIEAQRIAAVQQEIRMREASRAAKEERTPEAIAAYAQERERFKTIVRAVVGATAEWGRAGHGFRNIEGWQDAKALAASLEQDTKTLFQLQDEADRIAAVDTPGQAAEVVKKSTMPLYARTRAGILAWYLNDLLSGVITHVAYGVSNYVWNGFKTAVNGSAAAAVAEFEARILGRDNPDRVTFADVSAGLHAMFYAPAEYLPHAMKAFRTGIPYMRGASGTQIAAFGAKARQIFPNAAEGSLAYRVGRAIETPTRSIQAIHTMSYGAAFETYVMREAIRDALKAGLNGNASIAVKAAMKGIPVTDAFSQFVAKYRSDIPPHVLEEAHEYALRSVLMGKSPFGSLQTKVEGIANHYLLGKLYIPFARIGTEMVKEGILEQTPIIGQIWSQEARDDMLGKNGNAARQERIGRMVTGIGIAGGVIGLTAAGVLTGPGPSDPRARALWMQAGNRPFSIRVGGLNIPYMKWAGPLGLYIGATSALHDAASQLDEHGLAAGAHTLTSAFSELIGDITWLGAMADFFEATNQLARGSFSGFTRIGENITTGFIPFSTLLNQARQIADPQRRQVHGFLENLMNHIPGASTHLEPQLDWRGQPISNPWGQTMVSPQVDRTDPTTAELNRLNIGIARPKDTIKGVPLTDQEYTFFAAHRGAALASQLDRLVKMPYYQGLPDAKKIHLIQQAEASATRSAEGATQAQFRHLVIDANKARQAATQPVH